MNDYFGFTFGVDMGYGQIGPDLPPWVVGIQTAISANAVAEYERQLAAVPTALPPVIAPPSTMPPASLPSPPMGPAAPPPGGAAPGGAYGGSAPRPVPGPAGGGWSWDVYRREAERAARDSAKRQRAPRVPRPVVIEGEVLQRAGRTVGGVILRGIGRVIPGIGGVIFPSELGSGELTPEDMIEQVLREARDVPEPILPTGAQPSLPPIPQPSMPAPPIPQPEMQWPSPPSSVHTPPLPMPSPPTSAPPQPMPTRTRSTTRTRSPVPSSLQPEPWWRLISRTMTRAVPRLSTNTSQRFATPTSSASSATDPLTRAITSSLTGLQSSTLSSAPPRVRTRTRQRECQCDHGKKRRKKSERECRQRYNVVWASGPKKGKVAGTRCAQWSKK